MKELLYLVLFLTGSIFVQVWQPSFAPSVSQPLSTSPVPSKKAIKQSVKELKKQKKDNNKTYAWGMWLGIFGFYAAGIGMIALLIGLLPKVGISAWMLYTLGGGLVLMLIGTSLCLANMN
jgi:hypothetical protein